MHRLGTDVHHTLPRYRWLVAAACFAMVFTCLGFCSSTKGLYLAAITDTLGIKRSLYSFNDTFRYVTTTLINLVFGLLVSRFGARKMIAAGFLSLITSMLVYSVAESVYVFYLGGIFLGAGLAWTTTAMVGYVVDRWITEHRGTVMGAILAANGLGGALAAQIISPIIYQDGAGMGFRTAYRVTAVILFVVGAAVVLIVRDAPKEWYSGSASGKQKVKAQGWEGISFREAVRRPYFYVVLALVFLSGLALQGTHSMTSAHLKDVGFSPAHVASVLSIQSLMLCAMKFLTGIVYDKLGIRITAAICSVAGIGMILLLLLIRPSPLGNALALVQGFISAVGLPLETIMLPLLATELFGRKDYAKLMGIVAAACTAGCAIGVPVVNVFYDLLGSYAEALWGMVAVMIVVTVGLQMVLCVAKKEKKKQLTTEKIVVE